MEEAKSPNLAPGAIPAPGERLLAGASAVAVTSAQQAPSTVCVDQHALTGAHKVKVSGWRACAAHSVEAALGHLSISGEMDLC